MVDHLFEMLNNRHTKENIKIVTRESELHSNLSEQRASTAAAARWAPKPRTLNLIPAPPIQFPTDSNPNSLITIFTR